MEEIKIIDNRKKINLEESTAFPNDFTDKYMKLFNEEQLSAVIDLIRQTYKAGLEIGRNESPLFAVIPMSIMENRKLSANAKLLYAEITALSKKNGKCYATNKHLANMLGLKTTSIPNLLKELSGNGLVIINIKRSKKGTYRDIFISFFNEGGHSSTTMGGLAEEQGGASLGNEVKREIDKVEIDKVENPTERSSEGKIVNEIINLFQEVNPSIGKYFGVPPQRKAVERMLAIYGREKLEDVIKALVEINARPYWPKSTTPIELENNLGKYKALNDSEKNKKAESKLKIATIL